MKKRLFAFLLTFCLIFPAWSGFSVLALDSSVSENIGLPVTEEPIASENPFQKIHFYFGSEENAFIDDMTELQAATALVKSDYAAEAAMTARSGEPSDENVYITVQFAGDYLSDKTYLSLKAAREEAKTAAERDMAKTRQNAYSKSYHAEIVEKNLPLLSDVPYTDANPIDYSSFVTLTVPADDLDTAVLAEIAQNEEILHISLTDGFEVVSESSTDIALTNSEKTGWNDVLDCIGARSIVENGTYTGEGVKIGIYEGGVPDVTCSALTDVSIIIRDGDEETVNFYHTTYVATILALIAPNAQFYAANCPIGTDGVALEGIGYFIENDCDIVNMSMYYGTTSNSGCTYRYDIDGLYDYQVSTSGVAVVKSSGNCSQNSSGYITSPGFAYNHIM